MKLFTLVMMVAAASQAAAPEQVFITQYCAGCHNSSVKSGGLSLAAMDVLHPKRNAQEWEKAVVKLRAGMMPPSGMPRPDTKTLGTFVSSLETRLDRAAHLDPNPGRPALHRLNRTEYANSVRDLLDLDIDAAALLPADDSSHGFDNMAEVLNVSPTLMESYIRAGGKISRLAVGDPKMTPVVETYHLPSNLSQTGHIEGTPAGTRGGIVIRHNFEADGDYTLRLTLYFTTNTFVFGTHQKGEQIEVALNGKRMALFDVNPLMKVDDDLRTQPIHIAAGPQTITVAFLQNALGPVEDFVQPFDHSLGDLFLGRTQGLTGLPHLRDVGIQGPYKVTGVSDTPARRKIFSCRPQSLAEETPCAKQILTRLASSAYRKPIDGSDVDDLLSVFHTARKQSGFEASIRTGLQLILANPQFVFRFERTPAGAAPDTNYRVSPVELASRLSYFLWSSAPDRQLAEAAASGSLAQPRVLETQVKRMLAHPRSEALSRNFAGQWLYLRNLQDVQPDLFSYPNFERGLLESMRRETELLFDSIVRRDGNIVDLLTADYTFVDERLAKHYGIPNVQGNRFRQVAITDEKRKGLLGQASILTVTSYANRTSPVVRGKWVLDNLLGAPPPNPPANIPPLKENAAGTSPVPVRVRLEEHRSNPACASCHTMMDPIGFALESFDAVGATRIHDSGFDVDTAGQLVDGTKLNGPASLRAALVNHSDAYIRTFTVKLLSYALGRGVEYYDMPAVRAIDTEAARHDNRFSAIVMGIVRSTPFQMRRADAPVQGGL